MDREALGRRLHELGSIERPGLLKEWDELTPDARESYRRIGEAVAAEVFDAALVNVEELERKWRGWAIGLPAPNPLLKPTEAKHGADVLRLAIMAIERARAQTPPRSPTRAVPLKPTTTREVDADAAREALGAEDAGRVPVGTRRPPTPPRSQPTQMETLATTLPGPTYDGWYCSNHPPGERIANDRSRARCWACQQLNPERGGDLCACGHRRDAHTRYRGVDGQVDGCAGYRDPKTGNAADATIAKEIVRCRCDYFETEEEDGGA